MVCVVIALKTSGVCGRSQIPSSVRYRVASYFLCTVELEGPILAPVYTFGERVESF